MIDETSLALFIAPRSPFCRKVVASVVEFGLQHRIDLKIVDPWTCQALRAVNPLCKVPTLVLPDRTALFDSPVILQYLQTQSDQLLLPSGDARWDVLRREALADGLADAVIRRFVEGLGQADERASQMIHRQEQAIFAILDHFQNERAWMASAVDLGQVALACAIAYLDVRSPALAWQQDCPLLARWFYDFRARTSMMIAASPDAGQFRTLDPEPLPAAFVALSRTGQS
ncbi:glutathione S-transferase family protein [Methylobacterium sp. J-077]|uniref:glutathione S-transferase family protein n=1 Tax=Methylobacterium sp. J-077 TaxID=2836656 RepID=UPI001FB9BA66|nr:glutathione S-transferase N-terminal domain-containing protein [Methylobacterium sp. J-077]MCJ2126393.1 glutathione S-transferase N-terminal domain-containing protein [Methylobacterium sp. J-077]